MSQDLVYLATRCHANRARLIDPAYIQNYLAKARSLEELVSYMYTTYYSEKLTQLGRELTGHKLLRLFLDVFEERLQMILRYLGSPYDEFMRYYILRFDVRSVLRIMSEIIENIPHGPVESYKHRFSALNYEQLLKAKDLEEFLEILPGDLFGEAPKLALTLWDKYKSFYAVELSIWSAYYKGLIRELEEIPDEDANAIWAIIGTEIDLMDISIALGPMKYGFSVDYLDKILIEKTYKVSITKLKRMYTLEGYLATEAVPAVYKEIVEQYLIGADFFARTLGERLMMKEVLHMLPKNPTGFSYIFGVYKLFEFEYENLRIITEALSKGLKQEFIQQMIIV